MGTKTTLMMMRPMPIRMATKTMMTLMGMDMETATTMNTKTMTTIPTRTIRLQETLMGPIMTTITHTMMENLLIQDTRISLEQTNDIRKERVGRKEYSNI